jgi:hypothetical protein
VTFEDASGVSSGPPEGVIGLQLVHPPGSALALLAADYNHRFDEVGLRVTGRDNGMNISRMAQLPEQQVALHDGVAARVAALRAGARTIRLACAAASCRVPYPLLGSDRFRSRRPIWVGAQAAGAGSPAYRSIFHSLASQPELTSRLALAHLADYHRFPCAPGLFAFGPECRSRSLRNRCSLRRNPHIGRAGVRLPGRRSSAGNPGQVLTARPCHLGGRLAML